MTDQCDADQSDMHMMTNDVSCDICQSVCPDSPRELFQIFGAPVPTAECVPSLSLLRAFAVLDSELAVRPHK